MRTTLRIAGPVAVLLAAMLLAGCQSDRQATGVIFVPRGGHSVVHMGQLGGSGAQITRPGTDTENPADTGSGSGTRIISAVPPNVANAGSTSAAARAVERGLWQRLTDWAFGRGE